MIRRQWERLQEALEEIARESYDQVVILSEEDLRRATVEIVRAPRGEVKSAARTGEEGGADGD